MEINKPLFLPFINKKIIKNISSLYILQILNYVLPLLTIPYLILKLGVANFGTYTLAQTAISYFHVLISYGFDMTVTRDITRDVDDKKYISELFVTTIFIKLVLVVISFLALNIICYYNSSFYNYQLIFNAAFLWAVGLAIFPQWFFQGVQSMTFVTLINGICKILLTCSIFLFVNKESDLVLATFINSMGSVLAGILSLIFVFAKFNITLSWPRMVLLRHLVVDGFNIFLSQLMVNVYYSSSVFFIKLYYSDYALGSYSIAFKVYDIIARLITPISQAFFPYLSQLYQTNMPRYKFIIYRFIKVYALVFSAIGMVLYLANEFIIRMLSSGYDDMAIAALNVFAMGTIFLPFGQLFTFLLVIQNYGRQLLLITVFASTFNIIAAYFLVLHFGVVGGAVSMVLTFAFISITKGSYLLNKLKQIQI